MVEKITKKKTEEKEVKANSFRELSLKKQLPEALSKLNIFVKYSKSIEKEHLNRRLDDLNEFLEI